MEELEENIEDLELDELLDSQEIDQDFKLENLFEFSNEKLCEIVISFRYLGIFKDQAILAMQELARRREQGDQFIFEEYIEKNLKDLPSLSESKKLYNINIFGIK